MRWALGEMGPDLWRVDWSASVPACMMVPYFAVFLCVFATLREQERVMKSVSREAAKAQRFAKLDFRTLAACIAPCNRVQSTQSSSIVPNRASTTVTLSTPPAASATVTKSSQALSAVSAFSNNEAIVLSSTISVSPSVQSSS